MNNIFSNPLFGVFLTISTYMIGVKLYERFHSPMVNPLLIAIILSVTVMKLLGISYEDYMNGGICIGLLITPATAALGLSIYRKRKILKEQFIPIVCGCFAGSLLSMVSVVALCHICHVRKELILSLLPKSVTTAIAIDLSAQLGGITSVTMLAVLICGVLGAMINPLFIKILHITDPIAIGVGMGTASHAIGTTKAIEMGEIEGAVSGVAIGVAGIITVILSMFI
ncbi:MAG: LrgB family protein [Lachnospiraceae bacterium]